MSGRSQDAPAPLPRISGQPLVTIVTPTYSAAHWLPQCRASVAAQDYPNIEHVIVDGGSTDGTVELLRSWSGVTWVSEPDAGQSDAIIKGFRMGTGQVLTWLNADDELTPGAVSLVVKTMVERSADWVVGAAEVREGGSSRVVRPRRVTLRRLDLSNPIVQPSSFYTAAALRRAGGIDPHLHLAMDLDLWLRLLKAGVEPALVEDVLSVAHLHEDAKTRAVSAERWFWEMGVARAKNGRAVAAGVELGRSLAESLDDEPPSSARDIRTQVHHFQQLLQQQGVHVPRRALTAGLRTRLAVRAQSAARGSSWRHVCAPSPLTTRQTLLELAAAATTRLSRLGSRRRR
jgi:GT2 family glycosyltransferase